MSQPFQYDLFNQDAVFRQYETSTLFGINYDTVTRRVYERIGEVGDWKLVEEWTRQVPNYMLKTVVGLW